MIAIVQFPNGNTQIIAGNDSTQAYQLRIIRQYYDVELVSEQYDRWNYKATERK